MGGQQPPGQYRFFGGIDRLICLHRRATAAAFLRLLDDGHPPIGRY